MTTSHGGHSLWPSSWCRSWRCCGDAPILWSSVAAAWTVIAGLDIAAIAAGLDSPGLGTMVFLIVFPYALFRWGSGREAVIGLGIMSVPLVTNLVFYPDSAALTAASFAWLLFPCRPRDCRPIPRASAGQRYRRGQALRTRTAGTGVA